MSSSSSVPTTQQLLLVGGALIALTTTCFTLIHSLNAARELATTKRRLQKEMELRKMERAGRTKAERRLRKELKALIKGQTDGGVNLRPIARMESPFKGRCGTPRQGLLAPNAKGQIRLDASICRSSLDQLGKFSHIWVVFLFDQNTNWTEALCSENEGFTFRAKIAPPRLFGKRVGVFSTRSPHRPNPVGLTVVAVDSVNEKEGIINVSGVDMTDGTPILDIKPYIPYDVVLDHHVPEWVMAEDVPLWKLCIEPPAEEALREIVAERSTPFYSTYEDLVALLRDVLLQDPRSIHQGRGSAMDAASMVPYNCNIDDIAVEFLALEDSIKIVRAYVECRDALDHDDDGIEEKNDKSKRSEEGAGKAKDKFEESEKVDLKQSGTTEEISDERQ